MNEGSYTVEASLIMCFIICIMLGIVYMGFYVYDYYMAELIMTETMKRENRWVIECSDRVDGEIHWEECLWQFWLASYGTLPTITESGLKFSQQKKASPDISVSPEVSQKILLIII